MAGTLQKARRQANVIQRLEGLLGLDLAVNARGDPELEAIMRLEAIADALEMSLINQTAPAPQISLDALENIPGVGRVTARRILELLEA